MRYKRYFNRDFESFFMSMDRPSKPQSPAISCPYTMSAAYSACDLSRSEKFITYMITHARAHKMNSVSRSHEFDDLQLHSLSNRDGIRGLNKKTSILTVLISLPSRVLLSRSSNILRYHIGGI